VELENVVCVPHIGSATVQTRGWMATMAAEDIVSALTGRRPAHLVNPEAWRG
jgi:phosphoglycerate dehydrogenase-like enzyme